MSINYIYLITASGQDIKIEYKFKKQSTEDSFFEYLNDCIEGNKIFYTMRYSDISATFNGRSISVIDFKKIVGWED